MHNTMYNIIYNTNLNKLQAPGVICLCKDSGKSMAHDMAEGDR